MHNPETTDADQPAPEMPSTPPRREPRPTRDARSLLPLIAFALLVLVVAVVLLSALPAMAQSTAPAGEELNRIVLRVNDQILTLYEYERRKQEQVARLMANPSIDEALRQERLGQLGKLLVKNAYEEMLVMSRAKQLSVVVDDREVDQMLADVRAAQGIDTDEQMRQALATAGMTLEDLRASYRRDLIVRAVMGREVQDRIDLDEEALRLHYRAHADDFRIPEKRRLEAFQIRGDSGLDADQRRDVARRVLAAVEGGESLEAALEPFVEQGLANGPVDLGWLEAGDLEASLREVAWGLEPGAYSQPVEARGELQVLHLLEIQEGGQRPFSEVEGEIRARLQAERFEEELRSYLTELSDRAYVRENLPPEAVGYRALADELRPTDELELLRAPVAPAEEPAPQTGLDQGTDS